MAVPRKFVRKEVRKSYSVGYIGFRARLLCDAHMAVPLLTRKVVKKQTGRRRFVCNIGLEVNMVCDVQMPVSFVKRRVVNTQFKRTLRGSCMRVKSNWCRPKGIDSYVRRGSRGCTLMANLPKMFKKFSVHNVSGLELMIYNTGYLEMDQGKETSGVHSLGKGLLLGLDRTIQCGISFGSFCVKGEEGSDSTSKASRYSTLGEYAEHGGNSDLQLDVKGCKDIYASFDKYVEVELLEGDNKYDAGSLGKQVNDHYEFPLQLDLDRNGGKYLSPLADNGVRNLYTLHSVIVHSGDIRGGHYYAFIRPTLSDKWFKFDDARVTEEDAKSALNEQYGGHETKLSNAYMLVYIRESEISKIFCNVDEKDLPQNLQVRAGKHRVENKHHFNEKKHKVSASSREKSKLHEKEKDDLGGLALISKPFVYISRLQIRPSNLMEVNNAEKPSHVVLHIEHPTNDWLVETHLKNKLWISLSDGMAWFSILAVYLMVMRWRRRRRRSRMISVPDPFAGTPLPDVKKEDGIPVDKEEKDSILLDMEKNEDSEMWLLLVHEFARVSFSWIKTSNEDVEKNEGQKEKKTIFLRSLKAHLAVMAIEVSGSYIVRRFLGTKGDAPMTDIIGIFFMTGSAMLNVLSWRFSFSSIPPI
ncbi:hypothetical protein QYE76_053533 [Lolium multiflorum]|uniref:USP domain-containing protein n=1 Tax=Lolium multiflorum TaxID=4521 RepID=A0AAD8SWJ4_LOLMU|nr:hypothetical protein QYE76_053533 [Lolium multiflorum]